MHPHRSRNILFSRRRPWSAVIALLLAAVAAACTPDALLSPGEPRLNGSAAGQITVTPDSAVLGDSGVVLTVRGSGFTAGSWVSLDPWAPVTTTFVDDSTLTATIEGQLSWAATYQVTVWSELWEQSAPAPFVVLNTAPVITRMTPDWCEIGGDCGVVTLEGSNFMYGMRVQWNGSDVNVTLHSNTRATFNLDPYNLQWPELVKITALNPEPSAVSEPVLFQVGTRYMLHTHGATAGSSGFELEIYGENFSPGDSAYWNGSVRPTTVHNPRRMSAWISASDVAAPGAGVVTVRSWPVNMGEPFPVGTVTVRPLPYASVTSQLTLDLPVRDVVYSPATERLYATVYDGVHAGFLAVIDPSAGVVESYMWMGDSPRYLALTEDGRYLWVGVDGENRVRRVNLEWGYADLDVALDWGVVAEDLAPVPGRQHLVAVSRKETCCSPWHDGVAVYNGWTWSALGAATPAGQGSNVIEFGVRGSTLHGLNTDTGDDLIRTMQVDDSGVAVTYTGWGVAKGYDEMVFAGGRLYTSAGRVVDTGYNDWAGFFQGIGGAVRPDVRTGRAFFLTDRYIRVSDINTFGMLGTLPTPMLRFEHPSAQRRHLVRWGADGLAWHDADELFLLRSPIVGP